MPCKIDCIEGTVRSVLLIEKCPQNSVGPDVGVKSSPNVYKRYPKSSHNSLNIRVRFFKIAQKVTNNFGNFCKKFGCQELLKIAQSGHTAAQMLTVQCSRAVLEQRLI